MKLENGTWGLGGEQKGWLWPGFTAGSTSVGHQLPHPTFALLGSFIVFPEQSTMIHLYQFYFAHDLHVVSGSGKCYVLSCNELRSSDVEIVLHEESSTLSR